MIFSNMFKIWICVIAVFLTSEAFHLKGDDQNPVGAHCEKWGIQFEEGQKVTVPQECAQGTCINALKNEIGTLECPLFKIRPDCHLSGEDLTKSYPDCCSKPICPKV